MNAKAGLNIHLPSIPGHLRITQTLIEDTICDPCIGAKVIFGEIMDEFQRSRLKDYIWIPRVIDSSGFSSFKTRTFWLAWNLRALILPDRVLGVYYQNFQRGKDNFWQYYDLFHSGRAPIFRAQIGKIAKDEMDKASKGDRKEPSCYKVFFKNASQVLMPAPDFIKGSESQAGLRLNDLGVDEFTKIENTGKTGIDDQLIGRCTREVFNQHHMLWCNHHLFLATAEDTMHPAFERLSDYRRNIAKGNPDYKLISYSYKDMSDRISYNGRSFKATLREVKVLKDMKTRHTKQKFLQEALGIWSANGASWYPGEALDRCVAVGRQRGVIPITCRLEDETATEKTRYFLGVDPSKGDGKKADDGALVVLRAHPVVEEPTEDLADWHLSLVWAYKVRAADVEQWSGLIHYKERHFNFSGICLDHGGGGQWIKPELAKRRQRVADMTMDCLPICTPDDATAMHANYSLIMFSHGDESIKRKWPSSTSADGIIDAAHCEAREAIERGLIAWPKPPHEWGKAVLDTWPEEKVWSLKLLHLARKQLESISVLTDNEGKFILNKNNNHQFSARGRKDFAYATLHAFVRFLVWLRHSEQEYMLPDKDSVGVG